MDLATSKVLKSINLHGKIKKFASLICYFLIISGVLTYIFYAISKNNEKYKLVADYTKNKAQYKTEKIMINPRIRFLHNEKNLYDIYAKKAIHKDEQEVVLYDVVASGVIGRITSGELKVNQNGNHLVFTKNPVLILNK